MLRTEGDAAFGRTPALQTFVWFCSKSTQTSVKNVTLAASSKAGFHRSFSFKLLLLTEIGMLFPAARIKGRMSLRNGM